MIAIVVSEADAASEHVGEHLLELADWERDRDDVRPPAEGGGDVYRTDGYELRTFAGLHLDLEGVAAAFDDPAALVFASRHSGETGPLLSAHFTGNFGPAEFGGEDGALARAAPGLHRAVLAALAEHAPEDYEVGVECTHHGPSEVGVPSMFVELGSDEAEWRDPEGARAVAAAILDLADASAGAERTVVGFGGGHYAPRFERVLRETPWCVGHVAADWAVEAMGDPAEHRETIRRAFDASGAAHALLDGEHPDLRRVIEDLGFRVVSETWLRTVGDRPLDLVGDLATALCPVEDGLRFGTVESASFDVVDLPAELLAAAQGVDDDAVREAVEATTVAFETDHGGTRVAGRAAVADRTALEDLVERLAAVLRERYDAVRVGDEAVVAEETAFDPERARTLGVPEGPKFGRLSNGQSVEVDGEMIDPETVSRERTERFPL